MQNNYGLSTRLGHLFQLGVYYFTGLQQLAYCFSKSRSYDDFASLYSPAPAPAPAAQLT
jgi:hypothetical protein